MRQLERVRVTQGLEETALREQLLATGTGKAVRTAAVPARAVPMTRSAAYYAVRLLRSGVPG